MRILIVSDTHGSLHNFDAVIEREKEVDMLLHLGDVEGDTDYMQTVVDYPVHIVGGNNDYFSGLPGEMEIRIGSHKVFLTHGHGYHVSMDTKRLKQVARARGADIAMYGHTHRPDIDLEDDVKVINPGSLSYPRQSGRKATYIIMEIGNAGTAEFYLKYV